MGLARLPLIAICLLSVPVYAQYSGGSGTADDPYQIATAADLIALGETPDDYDKHFKLMADIDLSGYTYDRAVIAPDVDPNDEHYLFQGGAFAGVFNGNGHTMSHLTIKGRDYLGLFGRLDSGAEIFDLGLEAVDVNGGGSWVGSLVGYNGGSITASYSTGTVNGTDDVGGLAGASDGSITNSHSNSMVAGRYGVGGLVGSNSYGSITASHCSGTVSGERTVGGLVGGNWDGSITKSYSTCAVSGEWAVGGLAGSNTGSLAQCSSASVVKGAQAVGGLVGRHGYDCPNTGASGGIAVTGRAAVTVDALAVQGPAITGCYSIGPVAGEVSIGGLVGSNRATINNSYSWGETTGEDSVGGLVGENGVRCGRSGIPAMVADCYSAGLVTGAGTVGGLVGHNVAGETNNSFWDVESNSQAESDGGEGRTTAEMQTASTFLDAGWDFVGETENGTDDTWTILEGHEYPRLTWEVRASLPDPPDSATDVLQPSMLCWDAATRAAGHDVYIGDEEEAVASATTHSMAIYQGQLPAEMTCYDPSMLEYGKTYYWRIDEVHEADPNTIWKGPLWSFTTADYALVSVVDDFEYYEEVDSWLILTWTPGFLNGTGSHLWSTEQEVVHGGQMSMAMDYNNVAEPFYSETDRTFTTPWYWTPDGVETPQDWTIDDADTLTLYFRGAADNDVEPLYVTIEDSAGHIATVTHPDADAVLATEWQKWHISLADLQAAGVDVAAVKKMIIGVGNPDNPKPGGEGLIYIDDIFVTNRMP
jgi:hypothetical protein